MEFNNVEPRIIGKKIVRVKGLEKESDEVKILFDDGSILRMFHAQNCCEMVRIEDIDNDESVLIGAEVYRFVEAHADVGGLYSGSATWTFYKIATSLGHLVIRWIGESNGCYSERVNIEYIDPIEVFNQ